MNRIIDEFRRDDERILDRLVDGELTEEDRKLLLSGLDDEPGAWRRCALAFLESQSLRGDLGAIRAQSQAFAQAAPPLDTSPRGTVKSSHFFEVCLAMAACVAVAFGVGAWVRSGNQPSNGTNVANDDVRPNTILPQMAGSNSPWHRAKLNDPTTEGLDDIEVPVQEVENLTEDWLRKNHSAVPDGVRKALEQSGHRVLQRQQLVPMQSKDGRRVLVPVEQLDIEPNRRPAY